MRHNLEVNLNGKENDGFRSMLPMQMPLERKMAQDTGIIIAWSIRSICREFRGMDVHGVLGACRGRRDESGCPPMQVLL